MGFIIFSIEDDHLNMARSVAAGMHLVFAFLLVVLWGFAKKDDGDRQDLVYPLYTSFSSWTDADANEYRLMSKGTRQSWKDLQDNPEYYDIAQNPSWRDTVFAECVLQPESERCRSPDIRMVCGTLKECDQPKPLEFSVHQTVTPAFKDSGMTISLNWIVVVFFLVSAGFQITAATVSTNKFLLAPTVRFIEYSITAPLMTVGVALQSGIMHTHTLLMLATLSWTCMMVGLCSEKTWMAKSTMSEKLKAIKDEITIKEYAAERKQLDELRKIIYITQTVGWALFVITFYVVISAFQASQETCDSPEKAPKFIWAILYGQFLFSASFGVMQILEIVGAVPKDKADMGYIFLSFWSKTYLGWMIYGGNFVQA